MPVILDLAPVSPVSSPENWPGPARDAHPLCWVLPHTCQLPRLFPPPVPAGSTDSPRPSLSGLLLGVLQAHRPHWVLVLTCRICQLRAAGRQGGGQEDCPGEAWGCPSRGFVSQARGAQGWTQPPIQEVAHPRPLAQDPFLETRSAGPQLVQTPWWKGGEWSGHPPLPPSPQS